MNTFKLFAPCLVILGFAFSLQAQAIVNFSVDMSPESWINPDGVYLAGTFNGWTDEPMDDSDGDGIYTLSKLLQPGTYQFKFKNGPNYWEDIKLNHPDIPGDCVTGSYNDRFVAVGNTEIDYLACFNYCVSCSVVNDVIGYDEYFAASIENPFAPELEVIGMMAIPTLVDINDDGDLDLFVCHRTFVNPCWQVNAFEFYENQGTPDSPDFVRIPGETFGLPTAIAAITFVDIDDDGDLDAVTSNHCFNAVISYFENTGSSTQPVFQSTPTETFNISGGSVGFAMFNFGDLDGDGDYDALVNGYRPAMFVYLQNIGTATKFEFDLPVTDPFGLSIPLFHSSEWSQFIDWDCDGDLDILNLHWQYYDHNKWKIYLHENDGTPTAPHFLPLRQASSQTLVAPALGDMDGDGDMDMLSANLYFENVSETNCLVSAVSDRVKNTEIALFPNPATDFVMVQLTDEIPLQQVTVQIFNSLGVMIRQLEVSASDFSAGLRVEIGDLEAGFYTLRIGSEGQIASGKFLKME